MLENHDLSTQFLYNISKISQLIRLAKMTKKNESAKANLNKIRDKINDLKQQLKKNQAYTKIQNILNNSIQNAFTIEVIVPPKIRQKQINSQKSFSSQQSIPSHPSQASQQPQKSQNSQQSILSQVNATSKQSEPLPSKIKQENNYNQVQPKSNTSSLNLSFSSKQGKQKNIFAKPQIKKQQMQLSFRQKQKQPSLSQQKIVQQIIQKKSEPKSKNDNFSSNNLISIPSVKQSQTPVLPSLPSIQSFTKKQQKKQLSKIQNLSQIGSIKSQQKSNKTNENLLNQYFQIEPKHKKQKKQQYSKEYQTQKKYVQDPLDDDDKMSVMSGDVVSNQSIYKFLSDNADNFMDCIFFNDDIFDFTDKYLDKHAFLFGVNQPQQPKIKKLFVCSVMRFTLQQIIQNNNNNYQIQKQQMKNNMRVPLGLILLGKDSSVIKLEHLKFLLNFNSPLPIIYVLEQPEAINGLLCTFDSKTIELVRDANSGQLQKMNSQKSWLKTFPYSDSSYIKQKIQIVSKNIQRQVPQIIAQQLPNAIKITQNQQFIKQNLAVSFNYKFANKWISTTKPSYGICFIIDGVVKRFLQQKNQKDFDIFKKKCIDTKFQNPGIFCIKVDKENKQIRQDFWQLMVQLGPKRNPFIFLNLSNTFAQKVIIVTMKKEITLDTLRNMQTLELKSFEKQTQLTDCIQIITKANSKDYEVKIQLERFPFK